jgi:hypothetical protein
MEAAVEQLLKSPSAQVNTGGNGAASAIPLGSP